MTEIFLNPAIFSSEHAGGLPLHDYIRSVIADCGLECTSTCAGKPCQDFSYRSGNKSSMNKNVTKSEVNVILSLLLKEIADLKDEIASLKAG